MTVVGSGSYRYEVIETWGTLPTGWTFGPMSAVATDSQDRVYAFQRKDPPVLVFDKNGPSSPRGARARSPILTASTS